MYYRVLIDLRGFLYRDEPPEAWILYPSDKEIRHLNIRPPSYSELLKAECPKIDYGEFEETWRKLPVNERTLHYLIKQIEQILSYEEPVLSER